MRTLLLALAAAVAAPAQEPPRRPNVVFILADDWGWGDLGCTGHERLKTPNLDRLARQGILFTQFYVNGSVCSPTRAAFLTGRFPARLSMHGHLAAGEQNRARAMPNFLDPAVPTVTRALRAAGYATAHYGKWHLGASPDALLPDKYGFDEWRVSDPRFPDWNLNRPELRSKSSAMIVDETIKFIEKRKEGPFYVQAWLHDTHATLNPSEEQMKPYARLAPAGVPFKAAAQVYYAAATDADAQIGRLLARLDELGLARETIVIFSADNGPEEIMIGNASHSGVGSPGPFRGRKRSLYEGGVRVPFILRWPAGAPAGRVDNDTILSGVDFFPTLLAVSGAAAEKSGLDGEDMSAAFRGKASARTKPLFWEWRFRIAGHVQNRSPILSMREGRWKLLMNPDRSRVELYDIPAEPGELNNLADRHPGVVKSMSERLLAWQGALPKGPTDPGAGSNAYPWPREGR